MSCIQQELREKVSYCMDRALQVNNGIEDTCEWTSNMLSNKNPLLETTENTFQSKDGQ